MILRDVSFALGPGVFALVGANGAGKSTLLRALAGILPPASGAIVVDGHDLWDAPVAARRSLGFLPETPELFPYLTARELLQTANAIRGVAASAGLEWLERWLPPTSIDLQIGSLSAGQRRKLALAVATSHAPRVLLLDEPTNALDAQAVADLQGLLARWRERGCTVLLATHRPEELVATHDGRVVVADHTARLEAA